MSTVKTNNVQVGTSGTATNNFTWYQPATPDGTVRLGVGNTGATTADVVTATSDGNVGIGTSAPYDKLHIVGTNTGNITSEVYSSSSYPSMQITRGRGTAALPTAVQSGDTLGRFDFNGFNNVYSAFTAATIQAYASKTFTSTDWGGYLVFYTSNVTGSGGTAERMRIDQNGNVGIGTSSPNKKLHVQSGSSGASNYGVPGLAVESSSNVDLQMMGSTTGQLGITFSDSGNTQAGFIYYQNNGDYLQIAANGSERVRIDSSVMSLTGLQGIKFQATQSPSSDANVLDDYEEGTWTPNINSNNGTGTFTTKVGSYVKIGRQVTLWFMVDSGNSLAAGTTQYLAGLPFNVSSSMSNNQVTGQMGTNGPATRTQQLMSLSANRGVLYVYTGGSQETTTISFASGCVTYWTD